MVLKYIGRSDGKTLIFDEHVVLLERYDTGPSVVVMVRDGDGVTYTGPESMFRQHDPHKDWCACDVCYDEKNGKNPAPKGL